MQSFRAFAVLTALTLAAAAVAPAPAYAQAGSPPAPTFSAKWNNGLSLESSDGATKIQLGTLLQVDGRFAANDPSPIVDTFLVRRARLLVQGRVAKYFEFYFLPDFAGSAVNLFDAYVDTKFSNAFRIRAGKGKSPVGYEQMLSDPALPLPERSVANNLAPGRDVGVTAMGDLANGHFSYIAGVQNGVADAANGDTDANSGKDLVGRATVKFGPFGVAVGASHGAQVGTLPSFRSTAQQTFFSYASGVTANGTRNRVSPSAFVYYKSVGGFAEYLHATQAIQKGSTTNDVTNTGWNVTGLVALTGEKVSDRGVTPKTPFDPANGHWGALQLTVRVSSLTVDPLASSVAATGASLSAKALGVGVVWYSNPNVKHFLTFERTVFGGDPNGSRKAERAIVFRLQISLAPSL